MTCKVCGSKSESEYCFKHKPHKAMKRSKLKPRSDKEKKRMAEYIPLRNQFLLDNPKCQRCGNLSTEVHHSEGRIEDKLTDVTTFRALCRICHDYIESHPSEAYELGLSELRLKTTNE